MRASEVGSLENAKELETLLNELQTMRANTIANINALKDTTRITAESVARLKDQVTDIKTRMKELTNTHDIPSIK